MRMISICSLTGQILCEMEVKSLCEIQVTQKEVHLSVHKYEHKDVSKSIDFEDTNLSSVGFAE